MTTSDGGSTDSRRPSDVRQGSTLRDHDTPWYVALLPDRVLADLHRDLAALHIADTPTTYLAHHARRARLLGLLAAGLALVVLPLMGAPLRWVPLAGPVVVIVVAGARYGAGIVYPRFAVDVASREIDSALPHAILSTHALIQSGRDLTSAIALVAEMETAGAVADEFARIRDDVAWFDGDLLTALEHRRDETPSEDFAVFLDELLTVVQTGGDVSDFLATAVDEHFETTAERQERLAEATATYAEGYVTLVFAAPIFMLVVLVVIGFVEPAAQTFTTGLVYVGIPGLLITFVAIFHARVRPTLPHTGATPAVERPEPDAPPDEASDLAVGHHSARTRTRRLDLLRAPRRLLTERPRVILAPTAGLAALIAVGAGQLAGTDAVLTDPLQLSFVLLTPALVVLAPFGLLYEHRREVTHRVRSRVPAALHVVADGLENGVPVPEVFGLATRRTSGRLANALRQIDRDIRWHAPVPDALGRIDRRISDPPTIRAVELLGNALESTHDVGPLVHTIARFIQDQHDLVEERRTRTRPYVAVVAVGIVVFLTIVVLFDVFFLDRIATIDTATVGRAAVSGQTLPRPADIDVTAYRRLLYHAAIIQALGNGLALGIIIDDRPESGAKYAALFLAATALTLAGLGVLG